MEKYSKLYLLVEFHIRFGFLESILSGDEQLMYLHASVICLNVFSRTDSIDDELLKSFQNSISCSSGFTRMDSIIDKLFGYFQTSISCSGIFKR